MTAFLSRLFRCLPLFLFVFATNVLPSSTWNCDAQTQASISYDGTWLPASGYDPASMSLAGEKGSQTSSTGGAFAALAKLFAAEGTTLRLPATMTDELAAYQQAADQGLLIKTRTADLPYSNYRATWEAANGPVPEGFDVDHIIQRQHGGSDELFNLQLKPSGLNRSESSQAMWLNKPFPYGTVFNNVELVSPK